MIGVKQDQYLLGWRMRGDESSMNEEDRIITPTMVETDREIEQSLRPRTMDEYVS